MSKKFRSKHVFYISTSWLSKIFDNLAIPLINYHFLTFSRLPKALILLWYFFYYLYSLKSLSSALLISRYILGLGQHGRCCFCAAYPNHKMYLEIRSADEGAFSNFGFPLVWKTSNVNNSNALTERGSYGLPS